MERIIIISALIGVFLGLSINLLFAAIMNSVAISKGHENFHAFILVLFFGMFGILYVIALPDLKLREQLENASICMSEQHQDTDEYLQ
jgi:hypothetical protein